MSRPRIVIVGAGSAGYRTARTLARLTRGKADITLLNPTDYFLYLPLLPLLPLLPQVAVGILEPRRVTVSLTGTLRHVRLVLGEADDIDLDVRTVRHADPEGGVDTLTYDRLRERAVPEHAGRSDGPGAARGQDAPNRQDPPNEQDALHKRSAPDRPGPTAVPGTHGQPHVSPSPAASDTSAPGTERHTPAVPGPGTGKRASEKPGPAAVPGAPDSPQPPLPSPSPRPKPQAPPRRPAPQDPSKPAKGSEGES